VRGARAMFRRGSGRGACGGRVGRTFDGSLGCAVATGGRAGGGGKASGGKASGAGNASGGVMGGAKASSAGLGAETGGSKGGAGGASAWESGSGDSGMGGCGVASDGAAGASGGGTIGAVCVGALASGVGAGTGWGAGGIGGSGSAAGAEPCEGAAVPVSAPWSDGIEGPVREPDSNIMAIAGGGKGSGGSLRRTTSHSTSPSSKCRASEPSNIGRRRFRHRLKRVRGRATRRAARASGSFNS
jgi:hypothetical protein